MPSNSRAFITARRSLIVILDREKLEEAANGSSGVPEAEYQRLFRRPTKLCRL